MPSSIDTSVEVKITLSSGKEVNPFNSLTITQSINEHHTFEVRCYHRVFESEKAQVISASKDLVGQDITITLKSVRANQETVFKGIITEVAMVQSEGVQHEIILKGFSSSIKMESGPKLKVFIDKSLKDIASDIIARSSLKKTGNVQYTEAFKYCTQFNESDFQFLRRLAAIHGEWFYYDGSQMVIGEPSSLSTVKLKYSQDIMSLSTGMGAVPLQFTDTTYNSFDSKLYNGPSSLSPSGTDSYGSKMHSASKSIFPDKYKFMPRQVANNQSGIDNYSKSYFNSLVSGLVHVHGSGDHSGINVGVLADISTENDSSYGKFLITAATHHCDGTGNYTNSFTGIPSTLKTLPNPYFNKPNADFEIAKVVDNVDPEKKGRVKVKFMWMTDEKTNWISISQSYGGEASYKNRGNVFIPEIDDDVIVGFERGDCDKPYVAFSLMNGKALAIKDRDNKKNLKKIISTRSNNITFHDYAEGNEVVGLKMNVYSNSSKQKAKLHMLDDGSETKLEMTAIDELDIATDQKEVEILMKKDGSIKVTGKNINIEAEETLTLKGKDIKMEATNNIEGKANSVVKFEAMKDIELSATSNFTAKANAKVSIEGSAQAEFKGAQVSVKANAMLDLDGGGISNLKGGMVMIN